MRDPAKGILTYKGSVHYWRKKHRMSWRDLQRIAESLEAPETMKAFWEALKTIKLINNRVKTSDIFDKSYSGGDLVQFVDSMEQDFEGFWDFLRSMAAEAEEIIEGTINPWIDKWIPKEGAGGPLKP